MLTTMATSAATTSADGKTVAAQGEKQFRQRVWRLRLVDALLTRALAASFIDPRVSQTPLELRKRAEEATAIAEAEMIPK